MNFISEIESLIRACANSISEIYDLTENPPSKLKRKLISYHHHLKVLLEQVHAPILLIKELNETAKTLDIRSSEILQISTTFDFNTEIKNELHLLAINSSSILHLILNLPNDNISDLGIERAYSHINQLEKEIGNLEQKVRDLTFKLTTFSNETGKIQKNLSSNIQNAGSISDTLTQLDSKIADHIKSYEDKTEQIYEDLLKKQTNIHNLIGIISGEAIHGNYSSSAALEKKWADITRFASFSIMLVIVWLIGHALFYSSDQAFTWTTALLKIGFSITLSIPAAYAARESNKHRKQQYQYQQIAMDLQSITPYISSLPNDLQHKFKLDIANKIFGNNLQQENIESYPINIQELLLAIIGKISPTSQTANDEKDKPK